MGKDGWPSVGSEEQRWEPTAGRQDCRFETMAKRKYWSAVPPKIAGLTPNLDSATASLSEQAVGELQRFDSELGDRVATFAPVLLRSEAASSSQIEHLTASARNVLSAELGAKRGGNALEIVANTKAMRAALDLAEHIDVESIQAMHAVLMEGQPHHTPGKWRKEPVWIGTRSDSPFDAEFVAPAWERVADLMADLAVLSRERNAPAHAGIAIAHAQFETIHPFTDGNGRTGRAFAQALLRYRGITRNAAVPVSAGLLADIDGYHRALAEYRKGNPAAIVEVFADAALRAVANTRKLVGEIDEIVEGWKKLLAQHSIRKSSNAWRLLEIVARRPVTDAKTAAEEMGVNVTNIYPPLRRLANLGILTKADEFRFGSLWRSDAVLTAIDSFAERAGRRRWN